MGIKLSHSSIDKFKLCGRQYKLHYIDRIRDPKMTSALVFGIAMDEALGVLLLGKKEELTDEEKALSLIKPIDIFYDIMGKYDWSDLHYFKSDLDEKLLKSSEFSLPEYEQVRLSLIAKGELILAAYEKDIYPRIFRTVSIQSEGEMENAEGDILTSKTDFIADWEEDGNTVLFDNKTSSKKYTKRSVKESQQLSIYSESEGLDKCGYIVMVKKINHVDYKTCEKCNFESIKKHKTCFNVISGVRCNGEWLIETKPEAIIQVIIDDMPEETKELVFNEIARHALSIKKGRFDKNYDSCFQFGRKCSYYNYCRSGSMKGLNKLENRNGDEKGTRGRDKTSKR